MDISIKVTYKSEGLQKLRKAAGLSQSQLADLAGIKVQVLQQYERGARDINSARAVGPLCRRPRGRAGGCHRHTGPHRRGDARAPEKVRGTLTHRRGGRRAAPFLLSRRGTQWDSTGAI